jgi:hypothetical protein
MQQRLGKIVVGVFRVGIAQRTGLAHDVDVFAALERTLDFYALVLIVHFSYPLAVQPRSPTLRPRVTLELGTHAEFIPSGKFTIRAFAAAEFPKLFRAGKHFGKSHDPFTRSFIDSRQRLCPAATRALITM